MIGSRLGPYEITAKLGEGGMGEVYRATDSKLDRQVAIKVLPAAFTADPDRLARFEREAKLLAQLHHPHIASVFGLEESDRAGGGTRALVMELVEGEDLSAVIARGPLPSSEAVAIARQVAEALEAAHEKGIVHRDLKPQNIKVAADGTVKVLDFGLAKAMDAASSAASAIDLARSPTLMQSPTLTAAHGTQLGVILGTAAYMAPEQARGTAVDRRADIWAFGVVLHEMLTGRRLFEGEMVTDVLANVLKKDVDLAALPAETPAAIRRLLRRCLERDPKQRLQAIGEARIALAGDLEEAPAGTATGGATGRRSRLLTWLPWATAAAAVVGLLLPLRHPGSLAAPPFRTTIDLPPELTLDTYDRAVALSPDGRLLVLAANDAKSGRHLYLRSMDKLEPRLLAGTEGASYPFWSPDGRAIGFFADRKLRRFDLPDGPVRTLCDAPAGRGGTWGAGDRIVFAPAASGGLQQISAAGGEPQPFGSVPEGGVSQRLPYFLPGNDGLVYYQFGAGSGAKNGAYLADASGGGGRPFQPGESEVLPVAPGLVAFERDGLLMVQPFDRGKRELSGAPTPIASDVQFSPERRTTNVAFSAAGTLVYQLAPPPPLIQLEWLDRQGATIGAVGEPFAIRDLAVSPDGQRALVSAVSSRHAIGSQLWMVDLARGVRSPFGSPDERNLKPVWSPDGRWVALYERFGGRSVDRIAVRSADDATPSRGLLERPDEEYFPSSWSPDGTTLLYSFSSRRTKQSDIELIAVDGKSAPRTVVASPAEETSPIFSPDGKWIAYVSDESGAPQVYLVAYPALGRKWPVTSAGGLGFDWISSTELLYASPDSTLHSVRLRFTDRGVEVGAPQTEWGGRPMTGSFGYVPPLNRYLAANPVAGQTTRAALVLVTNWRSEIPQ